MALSMEGTGTEALAQPAAGHPAAAKTKEPQLTTVKSAIIKRGSGKRGEVLKCFCKLMGREDSKSCLPVAVAAIE